MTWQDELQKLDEELASGRISADDYRRRRDEVLAQASGAPGQPGPQVQAAAPQGQPGAAGPFPPPFRWESGPPEATQVVQPGQVGQPGAAQPQQGPSPEATQVVRPGQVGQPAQAPGEATQVVRPVGGPAGPADADRTQVVPGGMPPGGQFPGAPGQDADRTQVVPGGMPPGGQYPGQYPMQMFPAQPPTGPNWQQQQQDAPPWGSTDLPSLDLGNAWGVKQGPEVFDDTGGGGKAGKIIGVVVAVVLLAGIAFGAYMLWGRGESEPTAGGDTGTSQTSSPPTTSSSKPADPLAIGKLPGVAERKDITSFDSVPGLNYLTPDEVTAYTDGGASKTKLASSNEVALLLVQVTDATAAKAAAEQLGQIQVTNGMQLMSNVEGVQVTQVDAKDGNPARIRGHYASRNVVVRVDVTGSDLTTTQQKFTEILQAQLEVLPVNE